MKTLTSLLKEINDWQDATFTKATPLSAVTHLQREVTELTYAIQTKHLKRDNLGQLSIEEELADCQILLAGVAHLSNVDLEKVTELKMAINKAREWGKPDTEGVVEHVRDLKDWEVNMKLTGELPG